jgi:hypothetical protein
MLLLLGGGGGTPQDLLALIDGPRYFKARQVEVTPETMVQLAGKAPADSKQAVAQLLAIRWLGEHPDAVKKSKSARETLQQIAEGKKGQDPQGFARDYARSALARLDRKAGPAPPLPANSLRAEALKWFPEKSTIFGGLDFRPPRGVRPRSMDAMLRAFTGMIHDREQEQLFKYAERLGNIRLERISFAVVPDMNDDRQTRVFVRLTGRADRKRVAQFIGQEIKQAVLKEEKGPSGEPITVIDAGKNGPSFALVGDTEMLIGAFGGEARVDNHVAVVRESLGIRAGKTPNIVTGPYAGTLKSSPAQAVGLLIGDLPERWYEPLTDRHSPFKGLPRNFNFRLTRTERGFQLRFTGGAASGKEARAFVDSVDTLKREGIEGLKKLPAQMKVKAATVETLQAALKGVKVEARDALLTGDAALSNAAVKALEDLAEAALRLLARDLRGP